MAENTLCSGGLALLLGLLSWVPLTSASTLSGCNNTGIEINLDNGTLSGNLTNPNYPDWVPVNSSCIWLFNCPSGRIVKLHFHDLIFNKSSNSHSYLKVHDGATSTSPLITNFTAGESVSESNFSANELSGSKFYSSGTKMSLHLKKGSKENSGNFRFLVSYSSITPGKTCSVNNSFDENNNIILKPPVHLNLGKDLPTEVDCTWKVKPYRKGSQIDLTLDINKDLYCRAGNSYVFDGPYGSASKIKQNICKEQVGKSSFSFDAGFSLQLKSSNFTSVLQIKAREEDCVMEGWAFYGTKTYNLEGKHTSHIHCQRILNSHDGFPLMFKFLLVVLPYGCGNNSLQLFELDKHSNKSTLRVEFCKTTVIFPDIIIYSGRALIKMNAFNPSQSESYNRFGTHFYSTGPRLVSYRSYCSQYNSAEENANITLSARKGSFFTPNHIFGVSYRPYPPGMLCKWTLKPINVTDKEQIEIEIRRFDFSNGNDKDCNQDSVQLDFSGERVLRFCRTNVPPSIIYSGDAKTVNVTFVAKPLYTENSGFIAHYKVVSIPIVTPPSRRLSWTVIGVLIVSSCLLLACVAFCIYRCKKKRENQQELVQQMTNERDELEDTSPRDLRGPPPPYEGKVKDPQMAQHPTEEQPYPWFSPGTTVMEHSSRERRPNLERESEM